MFWKWNDGIKKFKLVGTISQKKYLLIQILILKNHIREKRLFESRDGGWKNYDLSLISKGGGIFKKVINK